MGTLLLKQKISATELKNFSISESKFKGQTIQYCTTALQKDAPQMKSPLDLCSKGFHAKRKHGTEVFMLLSSAWLFSDIISKHLLAPLKIQVINPYLPCEKQEMKARAV